MEINELISRLGLEYEPKEQDGKYIIELEDSDEYAKAYTKLGKSELVDLDPESVVMTENSNLMSYISDDFDITLEANFDSDTYKITFERA